MKIAYLILCHTEPTHIRRLAEKITHGTEDEVFIHVDGRYDIEPFQKGLESHARIHFIERRVASYWGGFSLIEAEVNLFRVAISVDKAFDRFVLMHGLEYPIKSNRDIHAFFEANIEKEFIRAQNISETCDPKLRHRYSLFWTLDKTTSICAKIANKLNSFCFLKTGIIPPFKRNYVRDKNKSKMQIYQGCGQFGVTRQLAEYLVKFHDENPIFNNYFKTVYAPDEIYFHTIVYNSPFVKKTVDGKAIARSHLTDFENLTYFEYPTTVTVFTQKSDWPKLRDSGFLYFRKATSASKELLDYIDERHRSQENEV